MTGKQAAEEMTTQGIGRPPVLHSFPGRNCAFSRNGEFFVKASGEPELTLKFAATRIETAA
jgi:hypothetical protein